MSTHVHRRMVGDILVATVVTVSHEEIAVPVSYQLLRDLAERQSPVNPEGRVILSFAGIRLEGCYPDRHTALACAADRLAWLLEQEGAPIDWTGVGDGKGWEIKWTITEEGV